MPVGISGAFSAWGRNIKVPRPSPLFLIPEPSTIAVSVGRPIDPVRYKGKDRDFMIADLHNEVLRQYEKAEKLEGSKSVICCSLQLILKWSSSPAFHLHFFLRGFCPDGYPVTDHKSDEKLRERVFTCWKAEATLKRQRQGWLCRQEWGR